MPRCPTCGYDHAAGPRCAQCGSALPTPVAVHAAPPSTLQLRLWSLGHFSVGWSVVWRMWVHMILAATAIAVLALIALPGSAGSLALALVLVLTPLIYDWVTKRVLRRRYGVALQRFVGFQVWGVWLTALMVLTMLLLLSIMVIGVLILFFVGQLG